MKRILICLLMFSTVNFLCATESLISTALKINSYDKKTNIAARSHIAVFGKAGIAFDSDTMRISAIWEDGLKLEGLPFSGSHGRFPSLQKKPLLFTKPGPGWAKSGSFSEPRTGDSPKLGPIPADWAKFKGFYRNGQNTIFTYTVGSSTVLDMPGFENGVFYRVLNITGSAELKTALATGKGEIKGNTAFVDGCALSVSVGSLTQAEDQVIFTIPAGTKTVIISYNKAANIGEAKKATPATDLGALIKGGAVQWPDVLKAESKIGDNKKAYTVDNIGVPYNNKYDKMRISAMDFFSDGTSAAISTWDGSVWIVKNIDDKLENVTWKKFAGGLHEPMGLKIVDDKIYTVADDQITRYHDLNNDGEADYYECFNNSWDLTNGFHAFCFDLHTDPAGNFYFAFGSPVRGGGRSFERLGRHHGSVLKISKDGSKLERYATGFRAPNGMGISPTGQVTTGDNEGTYVPRSPINWVNEGSFHGVVDTYAKYETLKSTPTVKQLSGKRAKHIEPSEMPKPLVWLQKKVDNSGGGQVWVTSDKWGPIKGELLHLSYGQSSLYLVLKEKKGEQMQGGVVKFPVRLTSSAMRARFNPKDGQLYIVGLKGWQTNAAKAGGFDRIRYTKKKFNLPIALSTSSKGVMLKFTEKLDKELANDPGSYSAKGSDIWWSHEYGSREYHLGQRDIALNKKKQGWTGLKIKSAKLQADGKSVFIEIENFQPIHQLEFSLDLESADGDEIIHKIHATVHEL